VRVRRFYILNLLVLFIGIILNLSLFILPSSIVPHINGATRWIKLGFFNISPIEILKLGVIFIFTHILTSNAYTEKNNTKEIKIFLPFVFIFLILSFLIPIKQKDIGNFFLISASFLLLIFIIFNKLRLIFKLVGIALIALVSLILTSQHRIDRVKNWFFSNSNVGDVASNYQVTQGYLNIHEGGWFGTGFGQSIFKYGYIPDIHTDLIFSLYINETGIIGFILYYILLLYINIFLIYKAVVSNNLYSILYTAFLSFYVMLQSFLNLFGILGIVPLKGITVPFLSYGGSSIFFLIIAYGFALILLKINLDKKNISF